jgi:hypothetical protein
MFIIERRTAGVLAALATTAAMAVLGNVWDRVDEVAAPSTENSTAAFANRSREMSTVRNALLANLFLAASSVVAPTIASAANDSADVAPPAPRVEPVAPREGYIWAPGYWEWNGLAYKWVSGRYIYERRVAHWVPDRWEQVGPHWQHVHGHWEQGHHQTLTKE